MFQPQAFIDSYCQLNGIINPASARKVTTISVTSYKSTAVIQDTTSTLISYQYTPVVLPSTKASLSSSTPTVGVYSDLTITLTISNPVLSTGVIIVYVPKWENINTGASFPGSMIGLLSSCSALQDIAGNTPTCTPVINSDNSGLDSIIVQNAFSSGSLSSGKVISLLLKNIRNPPTLQPYTSYAIFTADSLLNSIETCSGITLTLTKAATLSSSSFVKISGNQFVNQLSTYQIYLQLSDPMPAGGQIQVTLPKEITTNPSSISFSSGANINSGASISKISSTKFNIINGFPSSSYYLQAGKTILITLSSIQNPPSTNPTSSFTLATFDASGYGIESLASGLTVSASGGVLTNVVVAPYSYVGILEYPTILNVTFKTQSYVDSSSEVMITIPTGFTVTTGTCYCNGLKTTLYTCTVSSSTRIITLTSFTSLTISGGSTLTLAITNLTLRNPNTVAQSYYFTVQTASGGYSVDKGTSSSFTPVLTNITTMTVTPSSYVTYGSNVQYYFTAYLPSYIKMGALLYLVLPDDISIYSSSAINNQCNNYNSSGLLTTTYSCYIQSQKYITIKNAFLSSNSPDSTTIAFTIPGLRNSRSTSPSASFQFLIYDSQLSNVLYNFNSTLTVTMTTVGSITSAQILKNNTISGGISSYQFILTLTSFVQTGDYLLIKVPTSGGLSLNAGGSNSSCIGVSSNLKYVQSCSVISSIYLKLVIGLSSRRELASSSNSVASNIIFNVTNVQDPKSVKKSDSFEISVYTSGGYQVEMLASGLNVSNTLGHQLLPYQFSIQPTDYTVGAVTNYLFTFTPSLYLQDMYLTIKIPSEVSISGSSTNCSSVLGLSTSLSCTFNSSSRTITVSNGFQNYYQPTSLAFSIGLFQNPSSAIITSSFELNSYTSDGYLMEYLSNDIYINFICALPCLTCATGNSTKCLSCFTNFTTTNKPFLYTDTCHSTCPSGQSNYTAPLTCSACFRNCDQCSGPSISECLSCNDNLTLSNSSNGSSTCIYKDSGVITNLVQVPYFFPFLILSFIWIIATFFIQLNWHATEYIPSLLTGLSLIEYCHNFFQLYVFYYYKFWSPIYLAILTGIIGTYIVNVVLLILYILIIRKNKEVQFHVQMYKNSHYFILITSLVTTSRFFKIIYSNYAGIKQLSIDEFLINQRLKISVMVVSYLSLISSVGMILASIMGFIYSRDIELKYGMLVNGERIGLSFLIVVLIIMEYLSCNKEEQMRILQERERRKKHSLRLEKYDQFGSDSEKKQRTQKLKGISSLLQQDDNLQNIKDYKGKAIERRMSDIAPHSKDHKKSIHYKFKNKKFGMNDISYQTQNELMAAESDEEEERKINSNPLTPRRKAKYENFMVNKQMLIENTSIDLLGRSKDPESMSKMMQSIQREKTELQKLNQDLKEQRLALEKEKEQFQRMREEGVHSERGNSDERRSKLDTFNRKSPQSQKSKGSLKGNDSKSVSFKSIQKTKGRLDAVRESKSELNADLENTKGRSHRSLSKSNRSQLEMKKNKSQSNFSQNSENGGKCHGKSRETLKSIQKMKESMSQTSSFSSPSRNLSKRNQNTKLNQQNLANLEKKVIVKNTGTKIYYSDKSESSIEDLMDETPSNYNIPNGRLDGRSMGLRFGKKKGKGGLELEIDDSTNKSFNIMQKNKKKKKFRPESNLDVAQQDQDQSLEQYPTFDNDISRITRMQNEQTRGFSDLPLNDFQSFDKSYSQFNSYLQEGNQEMKQIRTKSKLNKKKKKQSHRSSQKSNSHQNNSSQVSFNPERLKALEVAYLTKLTPNKSHSKLEITNMPYIPRIPPGGNFTPDLLAKQSYNMNAFTQINNYQQN